MTSTDYKLDAILNCLRYYYLEFSYSNEIFRHTGIAKDLSAEFVPAQLISAWFSFKNPRPIHFTITELNDLLLYLENAKLVTSKNINDQKAFKINQEGITLLEKEGFVRKNRRLSNEYLFKWLPLIISALALIVSIYVALFKKWYSVSILSGLTWYFVYDLIISTNYFIFVSCLSGYTWHSNYEYKEHFK